MIYLPEVNSLFFSLTNDPLERDALLSRQRAQMSFSPDQDHAASAAQDQGRVEDIVGCTELAQPSMVSEVIKSPVSSPVADSVNQGPAISGDGHKMAPQPRNLHIWQVSRTKIISQRVLDTNADAGAPSTRCLYALKWMVFVSWCRIKNEDLVSCAVSVILSFLQDCLDKGRTSTLKVYVATISALNRTITSTSQISQ